MQLFLFTRDCYKRFYGAVSITVVLKGSDNKVEGSSPIKKNFLFLYLFFFFAFAKMQVIFRDLHVCRKKTCFNVLCTCKATSLSKMAKLVWRYSDVLKTCTRLQGGKSYPLDSKNAPKNLN